MCSSDEDAQEDNNMRISNETYILCPKCGAEATGLDNIDRAFGYKIVKDVITPYAECRACRGDKQHFEGQVHKEKQWASAAEWGKRINIRRTVFDSYLIELGYLEHDFESAGRGNNLVVTEKGSEHSATTNSSFHKVILWDFETYIEVVKMRASKASVHNICPRCKAYLDTMPGYNHLGSSHTCKRCGRICDYWHVSVMYDR